MSGAALEQCCVGWGAAIGCAALEKKIMSEGLLSHASNEKRGADGTCRIGSQYRKVGLLIRKPPIGCVQHSPIQAPDNVTGPSARQYDNNKPGRQSR